MGNLAASIREIGEVLVEGFPRWKHHEAYTLWGIAYFWDGAEFRPQVQWRWSTVIPDLFARIRRETKSVIEPPYNVPKLRNPALHQALYCLVNRDAVEQMVNTLLEEAGMRRGSVKIAEVEKILNDQRLIGEALEKYAQVREGGGVGPETDVIDFLLHYDVPEQEMKREILPSNSYVALAKRLLFRHGEKDLEAHLFREAKMEEVTRKAYRYHQDAVQQKMGEMAPELVSLYAREVGNGLSGQEEETMPEPTKVTGIELPGLRRVQVHRYALGIDWAGILEQREDRRKTARYFDRATLMRESVRQKLINEYYSKSEKDPAAALAELQARCAHATGVEREIVVDVLEIYRGVKVLEESGTIAHTMHVPTRKR